jgi:hypothetical protein
MKRGLGWFPASAVVLMTLAIGIPPASAQLQPAGATSLTPGNATSLGQAGYFVTSPPASASASVKFRVKNVKCTATRSAVALGSVIFTADAATAAEIYVQCINKVASYQAVVVVNGVRKPATFSPKVGDVIVTSANESATSAKAQVRDLTAAKALTASAGTGATISYVFDGVDTLLNSDGAKIPDPNFGTIRFTAGKEDNTAVGASGAVAVDQQTSTGILKIQTRTVGPAGTSWQEVFEHA